MFNKKEKNYKKINTSRVKWAFNIKIVFYKFWRVLCWWNIKINKHKLCKKFYQIFELSSGSIASVGDFINSMFHLLAKNLKRHILLTGYWFFKGNTAVLKILHSLRTVKENSASQQQSRYFDLVLEWI